MRSDGRRPPDLRPLSIECGAVPHAEGSCLITQGHTRVLVTASVESRVPPFLRDTGEGWITAEYGMLPRATRTRSPREAARGKQSGRTVEIQRLIGRALRGATDRRLLGDRTITLDCDVLVADAGTRCASVTGAFVALALATANLNREGLLAENPLKEGVAAVSVGMTTVAGKKGVLSPCVLLDLDYSEDSTADVDLNVVATSSGRFIEVQGTAEREPFTEAQLADMLSAARKGLKKIFAAQRAALSGHVPDAWLEATLRTS